MKSKVPDYLSFPLLGAIGGTLLLIIPFIGPLSFLPLIPLAELYDVIIPGEFGETGTHVEIGFAWITLQTIQAWMFYVSFFFLVGLIVGTIKHLTKGRVVLFVTSLIIVYASALGLQKVVGQLEYKQELTGFTTPTETVFACDKLNSLELKDDGSLWKFKQNGSMRSSSLQGNVDFNSNSFSSFDFRYIKNNHTIELIEQHKRDLSSCRNINGDSISDLYTIEFSDNFFQGDS